MVGSFSRKVGSVSRIGIGAAGIVALLIVLLGLAVAVVTQPARRVAGLTWTPRGVPPIGGISHLSSGPIDR